MITVKAKINLMGEKVGQITSVKVDSVSIGSPTTGFSYTGDLLSDSDGNFPIVYTIEINGTDFSGAVIVFDKENGYHPNTIEVDGTTYYEDDAQFEFPLTSGTTHYIRISNWNEPNQPLVITSISADINIYVDKKNLISFNSDIIDRNDSKYPSYGIISNGANLTVADFNGQILDLITQKTLHSGIKVRVWIDNDVDDIQEQVCEMEIRELSYNNNNKTVQFTLKDNLEDWQDITVDAINYDPRTDESKTAQFFYEYLYGITSNLGYSILQYDELDAMTKSKLASATIKYPLFESGNLWDSWNKLCELCLLHIYVENTNKIIVKYSI